MAAEAASNGVLDGAGGAVGSSTGSSALHARGLGGGLHAILCGPDAKALASPVPRVPPPPAPLAPLHLNLLLAGESGLGKSTFILNLAARIGLPLDGLELPDTKGFSVDDFEQRPELMRTTFPDVPLPEAQRTLKMCVQSSPGVNDIGNARRHLRALLRHVLRQRERDLPPKPAAAAAAAAAAAVGESPQHGYSLCLYFLPPHHVKPVDVEYMAALSRLVPLVPVVAKADCHTPDELAAHKRAVARALAERMARKEPGTWNPFKKLGRALGRFWRWLGDVQLAGVVQPMRVHRFSEAALAALELPESTGPRPGDIVRREGDPAGPYLNPNPNLPDPSIRVFSVICSRRFHCVPLPPDAEAGNGGGGGGGGCGGGDGDGGGGDDGGGRSVLVPVREYGWGAVNGVDRRHSDAMLLYRLLTEDVWALQQESCERHAAFCAEYAAAGRQLEEMVKKYTRPHAATLRLNASLLVHRTLEEKELLLIVAVLTALSCFLLGVEAGCTLVAHEVQEEREATKRRQQRRNGLCPFRW